MSATSNQSPPSPSTEAWLFWRLRAQILRTLVDQALNSARLRTTLILLLTVLFWLGMLFVFLEGFQIIGSMITHEGTRVETVHAIFNIFFLSLSGMLTLSSAILLYSSLYRSREARFLLTSPVRVRRIVWYKFQETLLLSCWGFFLLGSPLLVAYGLIAGAPWYYYASFLPFMVAFAFIPVGLGAILCLLFVRYFPRLRIHAVAMVSALSIVAVAIAVWVFIRDVNTGDTMTFQWFQSTLTRLQYSEQRWFPSWWLSSGLLESAHPADAQRQTSWTESAGFFCLLTSNAMVLYLLIGKIADWHYVAGLCSLAETGSTRKRVKAGLIDRCVMLLTRPFPRPMRLLLIKDLRVFRRDILQWSQFAIFFCLLTFYFMNARRIQYGGAANAWMMVVGYLNVAVVGLLLATFTTRFIYPLISLEGRKFWILGTLPIERKDILYGKFLFAAGISVIPCSVLILISDLMLQLESQSAWVILLHQLTCISLCLGLCGIAVGMGARLPNLREASPAKLASGFGGTLTLVISVIYIMACVLIGAIPTCWWVNRASRISAKPEHWFSPWVQLGTFEAVITGTVLTMILCLVATWVPLRSGLREFQHLEP